MTLKRYSEAEEVLGVQDNFRLRNRMLLDRHTIENGS